ncbi:metalloregulator ArsR/SmtB family transcription factor [Terrabacter terrigena]|uniref:Metalloregulator ArsR/SmtB family transcription factor n=1 Tax=Terrabacter terrigena TaxID=574718 RepID=A0ABW3MVA5_9MICO
MGRTWEALSDPTRRTIVEHLAREQLTAGEVAALFDTARPGISRHLRVLRESGVVEAEAVGQRRVYRLVPGALDEVERWCR